MPKKFSSDEEKREYNRNTMARWRAANPEKVEAAKPAAAERTSAWRASLSPEELAAHREDTNRWRAEFKSRDPEGYRKYSNEANKQQRDRVKAEVVAAYGGRCQCPGCDIAYPEFLTMHHVNGDGAAHRAEIFPHGTAKGGYRFYLWLKRQGFPKDGRFELRCYNCNCSEGFHGYCPHRGRDDVPGEPGP